MSDTPNYTPPTEIVKLVCPVLNEDGTPVVDLAVTFEVIPADEAREQIMALMEAGVPVYNINGGFRALPDESQTFTDYIDARCTDQEWRHQ